MGEYLTRLFNDLPFKRKLLLVSCLPVSDWLFLRAQSSFQECPKRAGRQPIDSLALGHFVQFPHGSDRAVPL